MPVDVVIRPLVHPQAAERIRKIRELTVSTGGSLGPLSSFDGFDEWLENPITLSLLARIESHREAKRDEVDAMKPCPSCKKERDDIDKDHRSYTAGVADALDSVAITILAGQNPQCEHDAPATGTDDRRGCA